jgi:hypothetical protein
MVSNQSATLKLPASDLQIKLQKKGLDSNYTDKTKYALQERERDGEAKKGRYLPAEKMLWPREMKITPTRAKWRLCS